MELWSWDLYECSGGTISGLGWLSVHVSTILYLCWWYAITIVLVPVRSVITVKLWQSSNSISKVGKEVMFNMWLPVPFAFTAAAAGHRSTLGYRAWVLREPWAQSNCDPLSCRSAPSPASDTLVSLAGGDIKQKLEFHQIHLELGALGYIETFLFYWSWGFFPKKTPPRPIFVFENTRVPPLDLKKYFFSNRLK